MTLHTAPTVGTFHAAGRSSSYRVFGPLLRVLLERIDHRVAVSKDALALVRGHLGGDYEVLFNGVDTTEIRSTPPRHSARPAIFFVGRHEERKGLDVLLRAVVDSDLDVTCWIAGDGPDSARLRSTYAGDTRLEWLGRIADPDKLAHLRGASVFCAPSLHGESFGVVLLEAMAAGTPVIASDLDGYRNVATHEVDALLVEPGDPGALRAAIARVLGDPATTETLVEAGCRRADEFAMSALAEAYTHTYRRIIDADRGRATGGRVRRRG